LSAAGETSSVAHVRSATREGTTIRRILLMLVPLVLVTGYAASADAAFHYENVGGAAFAGWDSCTDLPVGARCAFTQIEAMTAVTDPTTGIRQRDCVFLFQSRGVKLGDFVIQVFDETDAEACGPASVAVDASLTHGRVRGTIPAIDCHFDIATGVQTCTPANALQISLDWQGTGEVVRSSQLTYRYSYEPGQHCLFHAIPGRNGPAIASGEIAGLPAPLGSLRDDITSLGFGGSVTVGTNFGCYD
jgi:hypothetical protein